MPNPLTRPARKRHWHIFRRGEETPHIHITLVPIVKGERKRRKREKQAKKRYRKKPTDTVRLCADDIMTRLKLKSYQGTYAIAMAKYGLQRGIDGSTARHKSTQQYYRDTQKLVDSLKAEVEDLQKMTAHRMAQRVMPEEAQRAVFVAMRFRRFGWPWGLKSIRLCGGCLAEGSA